MFFFNDTATTEIYTLSLHDALPISRRQGRCCSPLRPRSRRRCPSRWQLAPQRAGNGLRCPGASAQNPSRRWRSEEHTSELQSHLNLVCRLLLEKTNTSEWLIGSDTH